MIVFFININIFINIIKISIKVLLIYLSLFKKMKVKNNEYLLLHKILLQLY